MKRLFTLLLVLAALWAGYWFVGSTALERGLAGWFEARRADGWVAETSEIRVRGFPSRFDTTLSGLELADPDTGLAWSMPFFQILALSYRPNHVIAVWPHEFTVATPEERLTVLSDRMRGSVVFEPHTGLALDRMTVEMRDVAVTSDAGWATGLTEGSLATEQAAAGPENAHRLGVQAGNVLVAEPLKASLDPADALPDRIGTLHLDATVGFDAPWDRRAIEERRPQPTFVDLDDLSAVWGELELRAAGELTIDADGVAEGRITVKAVNWREILGLAVAAGLVPEAISATVENALGILAGLSGPPDTLDAPLTFSDGRISFGPVPLGRAPRFVIR